MTADQQSLAEILIRRGQQLRPRAAVVGAMPRKAASAGNTPVIEVGTPIFQSAAEIVAAFLRKEEVQIKKNEPGTFDMLSAVEQNFISGQFDQLVLMNTLVVEEPGTVIGAEIAVVANRIERDFTEARPGFSLIAGNGGMDGIAVGEKILPFARFFTLVEHGLCLMIDFGQRAGVVPDGDHAPVGEGVDPRHGGDGVENGGFHFGPGDTAVIGETFVMDISGGAQQHDDPAGGRFCESRFCTGFIPAHPLVGVGQFKDRGSGQNGFAPVFPFRIAEKDHRVDTVIFRHPPLTDVDPAFPFFQRQREPLQVDDVIADLRNLPRTVRPFGGTVNECAGGVVVKLDRSRDVAFGTMVA